MTRIQQKVTAEARLGTGWRFFNHWHLRVFNIKPNVGRHNDWLYGGQIGSNDLRVGKLVGHFDGPIANACGEVENISWRSFGRDGSKEELPTHEPLHGQVLDRQSLLLQLIVGESIG